MFQLRVGLVLNSYCDGFMGREFQGPYRVEAFGDDWVVVRCVDGKPTFAEFSSFEEMLGKLEKWSKEKYYDS